jgi:catechol 2,3-dioxygenase-like lactoylglutathione lyase family enzyme
MLGTEALLVCGTTANACIETTLREAYLRDYDVVAVTDCVAAVRPEWEPTAHAVWSQYLGVLATSDEVLEWLNVARAPRVLGLAHVLLETSDLEQAERFYVGVLGLTVRARDSARDGRPLVVMDEGLTLTSGRSGAQQSIEHIAFRGRAVRQLAERARAEGVAIVRGPEASAGGLALWLLDPDGNELEVFGD